MMSTEIITALIAAISSIAVCLIKGAIDRRKMMVEIEQKNQENLQKILSDLSKREDARQEESVRWRNQCEKMLTDLQHSIDKSNIQLTNVEERLSDRIDSLAKHVEKHNNFAERMPVVEEQIKVINHRIDDLERKEG